MPLIAKLPRKQRKYNPDERRKARQKVYNSSKWKVLRVAKLQESPLCEKCLKEGKITPSVHVHHIQSFTQSIDELQLQQLAYDYDNLMSLCAECHQKIHNEQKKTPSKGKC